MKNFRFIYLAAASLLFAACASEEEGSNSPVAAIVHADISQTINSRATATDNSWSEGDAIGVYIISASTTTFAKNVKYVATDETGNFTSDTPIYFMDNKEQDFIAYYPYQETDNIDEEGWLKNAWDINYSDPGKTLAYDFLLAGTVTADKASPVVDFKDTNEGSDYDAQKDHRFKHKMALVEFNIKTGFGVDGYYNTLQKIVLKNIKSTGKVNVKTGVIDTWDATAAPQTMTIDKNMESTIHCQFILFPQTIENNKLDLEFLVKLSEETINVYTTSIDLTDDGFESGKKYTYNITVNNTSISIKQANIMPWMEYPQGDLDADFQ